MVIRIYRLSHWLYERGVPFLPWILKSINRILFAVVLPPSVKIGKGVVIGYEGLGTVIHRRVVIGDEVIIASGVTIGGRSGIEKVPQIGNRCYIGTGAKILGDVTLGTGVTVGANAVVLEDLPDYAVAVGVPAKVIKINRPEDMPDYFSFKNKG
jgi:serine O-acetyltransferase